MTEKTNSILSANVRAKIDQWQKRYPVDRKQSAVMQALMFAQDENGGWLNESLMDAVADYLGMPRIAVYEVATFYTMYHLDPVGKHVIHVCTNISCMLNGADTILGHLKERLKIELNETTQDGKFTLKEAECLAACAAAPMFQINRQYYENLTKEKVDTILAELE